MGYRNEYGRQSEAATELGEILRMEDPIVANFVHRHEALRKRVAVLERAIEEISAIAAHPTDSSLRDRSQISSLAQKALDG